MPAINPELLKLIQHKKVSTLDILNDNDDKSPSESGTTLTRADVKAIAEAITDDLKASDKGILDSYRLNSLTFLPPFPRDHGSKYSSDAYHHLYLHMMKLPLHQSDEVRQKIWALIEIEKGDISKKSRREITEKINDKLEEWESISKKESISLTQYINEKCI